MTININVNVLNVISLNCYNIYQYVYFLEYVHFCL